jgi:hypothetical protein
LGTLGNRGNSTKISNKDVLPKSIDSTVGGAFSMVRVIVLSIQTKMSCKFVKLILISLLFRVDDNMKYSLLMLVVFFFFFLD